MDEDGSNEALRAPGGAELPPIELRRGGRRFGPEPPEMEQIEPLRVPPYGQEYEKPINAT